MREGASVSVVHATVSEVDLQISTRTLPTVRNSTLPATQQTPVNAPQPSDSCVVRLTRFLGPFGYPSGKKNAKKNISLFGNSNLIVACHNGRPCPQIPTKGTVGRNIWPAALHVATPCHSHFLTQTRIELT